MKLIKKTKSICPKCFKKISADLYEHNNKIIMKKSCKNHGYFSSIVEKNAIFYKSSQNIWKKQKIQPRTLIIPVTYKCNLNCRYCYLPDRKQKDIPLTKIKSLIKSSKHKTIGFSGGEPTLRKELQELIEYAKLQGKSTCILSNCIKLSSLEYAKSLKNAGLDYALFSLNALDDKIFEKIEGKPLLMLKKKAFKNAEKLKLKLILSFSWLKGINDSEFKKVFKLALKNNNFVHELRCRTYSMIGRHKNYEKPFLSDFASLLAKSTGIDYKEFIDYWPKSKMPANQYRYSINYYDFIFNTKKARKLKSSILKYPLYLIYLAKHLYLKNIIRILYSKLAKKSCPFLIINLFKWPDKYDIDLSEHDICELDHYTLDNNISCFFDALMKDEKIRNTKK
ncbi:MAG: radical SAM protein [archaeon]